MTCVQLFQGEFAFSQNGELGGCCCGCCCRLCQCVDVTINYVYLKRGRKKQSKFARSKLNLCLFDGNECQHREREGS